MGSFHFRPRMAGANKKVAYLVLPATSCEWLGQGFKALALRGDAYAVVKGAASGRVQAIRVGLAADALPCIWDGPSNNFVLRSSTDESLALEVHFRKYEAGSGISLWHSRRANPCRWMLNSNRTLSPVGRPHLVIGLHLDGESLQLVPFGDPLSITLIGDDAASTAVALEKAARARGHTAPYPEPLSQFPSSAMDRYGALVLGNTSSLTAPVSELGACGLPHCTVHLATSPSSIPQIFVSQVAAGAQVEGAQSAIAGKSVTAFDEEDPS
jgi:hypothetical protein